jgi:hypothetical protein
MMVYWSRKSELSARSRLCQCVSEFKDIVTAGGGVLLSQACGISATVHRHSLRSTYTTSKYRVRQANFLFYMNICI